MEKDKGQIMTPVQYELLNILSVIGIGVIAVYKQWKQNETQH